MKKIEIINVKTPEFPKNDENISIDLDDLYSEKSLTYSDSLEKYTNEPSLLIKINSDFKKCESKLTILLHKYYFLKLFIRTIIKNDEFNNEMLAIDKYVNRIKKYFLDLKKEKNMFLKKNILTENDISNMYYGISDFFNILNALEEDLYKFENKYYPKTKMISYNMCKDKTYQELEKIAAEVNEMISNYKSLTDAYDYVCYNSGELIFQTVDTLVKTIKENTGKSKININNNYFIENEIIMFIDYRGWLELFNKFLYVKEKTDKSIFKEESLLEKYKKLELMFFVVLIYNEHISRRDGNYER